MGSNDDKCSLNPVCPGGNQGCTVNWVNIQNHINDLYRENEELRKSMQYLPKAFEFRVTMIILLAIYFSTNPTAVEAVKKIIGF